MIFSGARVLDFAPYFLCHKLSKTTGIRQIIAVITLLVSIVEEICRTYVRFFLDHVRA